MAFFPSVCLQYHDSLDKTVMLPLRTSALLAWAGISFGALTARQNSPSQTYAECQKKTKDPLSGCPDGTIFVSQNDTNADFQSIQTAIASIPNNTDAYTILIGAGIYTEQLNVTRQGPLTLLGQSDRPAADEPYANVFGSNATDKAAVNDVQIYWNSANFNKTFTDNVYTGVCTYSYFGSDVEYPTGSNASPSLDVTVN